MFIVIGSVFGVFSIVALACFFDNVKRLWNWCFDCFSSPANGAQGERTQLVNASHHIVQPLNSNNNNNNTSSARNSAFLLPLRPTANERATTDLTARWSTSTLTAQRRANADYRSLKKNCLRVFSCTSLV